MAIRRQVAVLGLGRFGQAVALELTRLGHDVLAVDRDERVVQDIADEVTHVKMGSDWLRRLTADNTERRDQALEFQRTVDRLFSFGGFRGDEEDSPIRLARRFRELAGFDDQEIDEIAALSTEARSMMEERIAAASTLADTGS